MASNFLIMFVGVWLCSLIVSEGHASPSCDPIHIRSSSKLPFPITLSPKNIRRRSSRSLALYSLSDIPRGGGGEDDEDDSSSVSVTPDETLPAGIAGASMTAFQATVPHSSTAFTHSSNRVVVEAEHQETVQGDNKSTTSNDGDLMVPTPPPSVLAQRLVNLRERTLPAILMLVVVGGIAKVYKENGLLFLTLGLQGGMYQETTRVIGGDFPHLFYKWYWFVTSSIAMNAPRVLAWESSEIAATVTVMVLLGIASVIVRFNWKGAQIDEFRDFLRQAAVSFLASLLVMLPSSYWISTLEQFGWKWVVLPAALVIINDTMAFFFGIAFGRHKLLPVISPGKTWEGFLGAAASTIIAAYFLFESQQDAIVLSLAVSLIGPFGGFLASMIKRAYAQKDFGELLPGHGGIVDRLDCQLILAPVFFLYLFLTRKYNSIYPWQD